MISAEPKPAPRYSVYAPDPPKEDPPKPDRPTGRPPGGVVVIGGCGCFTTLLLLFLVTPLLAVAWWRLFRWADAHFPALGAL